MRRLHRQFEMAARCNWSHRAAVNVLTAIAVASAPTACAQSEFDEFSMGKESTKLQWSEDFETVTFYKVNAPGAQPFVVMPSMAPPIQVPPQIGRTIKLAGLEKHGIVLIQLAPHVATPGALDQVLDNYNHQVTPGSRFVAFASRHSEGNPIYTSGGVEKVVTNQAVVKFRRGTNPQDAVALLT